MPYQPPAFKPIGSKPAQQSKRERDATRENSSRRGYGYRWQKAGKIYLANNPLCLRCWENDNIVRSTVVDHITPHRGDQNLLWDQSNWQPLCKQCHDRKTAREDGGFGR